MRTTIISVSVFMIAILCIVLFSNLVTSGNCLNSQGPPQNIINDNGIGPFTKVNLAPIDPVKVKKGLAIFTAKCNLCHELDVNKVGPPIRNAVKTYKPEFILNMIVNPLEMQKSNVTVQGLLKKYNNVPMPDQKIAQEDALAILDYLRSIVK